jgi:asparagine synthase (glutamine-hydrolysing)
MEYGGRWSITYNGEIYNYRALRSELEAAGHQFRTSSDTEVILAAYAEWKSGCLLRLRGMFAFAIWDKVERRLFAARDLFGEKPLYFALGGGSNSALLIASEMKAILASDLVNPVLDRAAVDSFLVLGYLPPHKTIYSNIHTLPAAHFLEYSGGSLRLEQYWRPQVGTGTMELSDAVTELDVLMKQAVRRQLVADVPVGAFLSGGIDSSMIVAMAQEESSQPLQTFSVGFGEMINELPYAKSVADRWQTEHHEIDLGTPRVGELLERMVDVYDEPFADSSHIPTYLISEFARRTVKVVLSGDGGDELFGGYGRYHDIQLSESAHRSWAAWAVLRLASRAIKERHGGLHHYSVAVGLATRANDGWSRCLLSQATFSDRQRRALWDRDVTPLNEVLRDNGRRPQQRESGLDQAFYFDVTTYLPGDILVKVDRAAMAHGLETRAPFLDRDLAEFALSLPSRFKVNGRESKVLLRSASARYLPSAVRSRRKQGFGAPYGIWLGRSDVEPLLQRVFARGSALRELLPGIKPGIPKSRNYRTWTLLTLGLWLEGTRGRAI